MQTTHTQGWNVYNQLSGLFKRGVKLRVVQNTPNSVYPDLDTKDLAEDGLAMVQAINFTKLEGDGILHTKLWVVDGKHFYVGSANMDWRSLTQVGRVMGKDRLVWSYKLTTHQYTSAPAWNPCSSGVEHLATIYKVLCSIPDY